MKIYMEIIDECITNCPLFSYELLSVICIDMSLASACYMLLSISKYGRIGEFVIARGCK